jgi:hypothetical protein
MESLLNLTWIAVAAGLLAAVRPKRGQILVAVLCAVALLFPIISASDDFAADRGALRDAAVLAALSIIVATLMALALLESPRVTWRRILLPVKSDPRSPPRR